MCGLSKMAGKDPRTGLTQKQEKFAQGLITEESQSAAYRKAYNTQNYAPEAVWTQASVLAKNKKVVERVNYLQDRIQKRMEVTQASLIRELEEARQMGIEERQSAAMTGATMGKARIAGLDKVTVVGDKDEPITMIQRVIVDRVISLESDKSGGM